MLAEFSINPRIWLKRFGLTVLEFFLPRLCLFCDAAVGEEAEVAVCPACQGQINWVASPLCTCCGKMFADREGPDRACGPASWRRGWGSGVASIGCVRGEMTSSREPRPHPDFYGAPVHASTDGRSKSGCPGLYTVAPARPAGARIGHL